ncbi:LysR family transcriptional regulator [Acetobacter sp. DsW_063]|uniref:LysR family transcriptional regulator n=1 Tax=Acetobacter sp. DsW_063 TaxID=1514894 RepID=UPI000A3B303D|nr:LysR family transcriptional regulator [Acetobacter sp. DsW_063]OUJ14014.1 LysR family transcriptional regulator [Acetobacter sp. DsW_063]
MTKTIDLNLLHALDVLLTERSVTAAARRLGLSPSATSRTLARLRVATGDALLVQAGRSLVTTPYAEQLAERVHILAQETRTVLTPALGHVEPALLNRTFRIRANEGFVTLFAPALVAEIAKAAPLVRLCFVPKPDKNATPLRDGTIDLEIGTTGASAPEMKSQLIFRDRFIGVACKNHPLLGKPVTPQLYAACRHVVASRRGASKGPVDDALRDLGLRREVVAIVPSFLDALNIARNSDLIALVPSSSLDTQTNRANSLQQFELPVSTPELAISAMWHPRLDSDPGHRWLRQKLMATCKTSS